MHTYSQSVHLSEEPVTAGFNLALALDKVIPVVCNLTRFLYVAEECLSRRTDELVPLSDGKLAVDLVDLFLDPVDILPLFKHLCDGRERITLVLSNRL